MTLALRGFQVLTWGMAFTVVGAISQSSTRAQCVEDCRVIHTFTGEAAGDNFGWVSDDIGDLDGDGVHDLVLTSPFFGSNNVGRLYVYSGATGTLLFDPITGLVNNGQLGRDIDSAFDVNRDGTPDIVGGAPFGGIGQAIVYSGVDGQVIVTASAETANDSFGDAVAGVGDVNGDMIPDIAVGASAHDAVGNNAGRAYLISGADGQILCSIDGESAGDNFGNGVARLEDLDNDGSSISQSAPRTPDPAVQVVPMSIPAQNVSPAILTHSFRCCHRRPRRDSDCFFLTVVT